MVTGFLPDRRACSRSRMPLGLTVMLGRGAGTESASSSSSVDDESEPWREGCASVSGEEGGEWLASELDGGVGNDSD